MFFSKFRILKKTTSRIGNLILLIQMLQIEQMKKLWYFLSSVNFSEVFPWRWASVSPWNTPLWKCVFQYSYMRIFNLWHCGNDMKQRFHDKRWFNTENIHQPTNEPLIIYHNWYCHWLSLNDSNFHDNTHTHTCQIKLTLSWILYDGNLLIVIGYDWKESFTLVV